MLNVDLIVYEGLDELDLVGPLEVLRRAEAAGAPVQSRVVAEVLRPVRCANGMTLHPEGLPSEAAGLLVPGGGWAADSASGARQQLGRGYWQGVIRRAHARGNLVMSVCTGAMLLAEAGVLDGRRCTTHWAATEDLARYNVALVGSRVVDDGDIVTAGGVLCGIDLALWMVMRTTGGPALSASIAKALVYDWDPAVVATSPGQCETAASQSS